MEKKKISAQIVADSVNKQGSRITSFILTYPRMIHAELMTHRLFSRNSASSRAIPFEKMVGIVEEDPFIPIAWQKDHKGMQGNEYITGKKEVNYCIDTWLWAKKRALRSAKDLNDKIAYPNGDFDSSYDEVDVTKQLCNRLLEPFMWHTVLVTATEWDNWFDLRCPKYELHDQGKLIDTFRSKKDFLKGLKNGSDKENTDNYLWGKPVKQLNVIDWLKHNSSQAEIHIQALAEAMWDVMNESTPKQLQAGEWHIPFGDKILDRDIIEYVKGMFYSRSEVEETIQKFKIKIATARCARLSYMTFEGEINYEKDVQLHDHLLKNKHASAFEHCYQVLDEEKYNILGKMTLHPEEGYVFEKGWVDNIRGFISYRRILNI